MPDLICNYCATVCPGLPRDICFKPRLGKWIPVIYALPKEGEKVTALIAMDTGIVWVDTVDATFVAGAFVFDDTGREDYVVTHWMRHPENPNGREIREILKEVER